MRGKREKQSESAVGSGVSRLRCAGRKCSARLELSWEKPDDVVRSGWLHRHLQDSMYGAEGFFAGESSLHYCPTCAGKVRPAPHPDLVDAILSGATNSEPRVASSSLRQETPR